MVQSSRGWDAAPHSGWGGQTIGTFLGERGRPPCRRPSRRCVPRPPRRRCAPVFPARTSSPRPPMARTLRRPRAPLSPARVGWAGTAVGRPARSWAAVGRARGWLRGVPGDRGRVGGGACGGGGAAGSQGPGGQRACAVGRPALSPEAAAPPAMDGRTPVPFYEWASLGPGRPRFLEARGDGWRAGARLRNEWPGARWLEAEVHLCCMQSAEAGVEGRWGAGGWWVFRLAAHPPLSRSIGYSQWAGVRSPRLLRKGNAALQSLGCVRFRPGPAGLLALRFQPLRTAKHPQGWRGCCHRGRNARCVPPSSARCLRAPVQILPGASHPELL